jgi:hypothetical protein
VCGPRQAKRYTFEVAQEMAVDTDSSSSSGEDEDNNDE